MNKPAKRIFALVLIVVIVGVVFAQITIPLKEQIPVMLKALDYNKSTVDKVKDKYNIALIYDQNNELSRIMMEEVNKVIKDNKKIKVHKKKIQAIPIPYTTKEKLEKKVFIKKLHAFFICAGAESFYAGINEVAKYNKIIIMSPNPADVRGGVATIGVSGTASGYKPLVNLVQAKNSNLDLEFKLLKISEVIK